MLVLTGGAGFIGSCFLAKLNQEGIADVLVVDNLGSSEKWKNLRGKTFTDYVQKLDFLKLLEAERLPTNITAVVHLGACSSTTEQDAEYFMRNNYRFSQLLVEWTLRRNLRFVYASSAATYGDGAEGFNDDVSRIRRLRPLNMYGFSKHLFDLWALQTGALERVAGLKFFNVFGPNEYHKGEMASVIFKAHRQINESGSLKLFRSYRSDIGDGEQRRDFVYVKDCVNLLWWLLERREVNGIFNVGAGAARSWNDLGSTVFAALGRSPNIDYVDMPELLRAKYQYFTEASLTKLRAAGYAAPFTPLEEAVRDYVVNYLSAPDPYC